MSQPCTEPAIELTGVTRRFGHKIAVRDLSLRVPRGAILGFVGPNGAGKSTTLRMLMGLLSPNEGTVRVLGRDPRVAAASLRQSVGYVPETHLMYRWMRVDELLRFCSALYDHWDDVQCTALLEQFDLPPDRKIKHLSKGMLAKLSLVLAICHRPEVLILDEPTSGLDPIVREEFLDGVLRSLCDAEMTVVLSSHSLGDVQRLADSVAILCEGELLTHCPTGELLARTKRIRAVLRDGCGPGVAPAGAIWERVQGREWLLTVRDCTPEAIERLRSAGALEHVEVSDLALEDIFKDYVRGRKASP